METNRTVPDLSLASLKRQLRVAESAVHSYDFVADAVPIMTSLQSPTTRTLHAIAANRAHFFRLEEEIKAAQAEERELQAIVDESEALKAQPLLRNFKGRVGTELQKVNAEKEIEDPAWAEGSVSAAVLLSGGAKSKGIATSLSADGEMVVEAHGAESRPVSLEIGERPTHFVPDEDDEVATAIAEQIVFTLPRDAAGTVLEVVPSTLVRPTRYATTTVYTPAANPTTTQKASIGRPSISDATSTNMRDLAISPLLRKQKRERQTLTEALCGVKPSDVATNNGVSGSNRQRVFLNPMYGNTTAAPAPADVPPTKSLKEMLAEQKAMSDAAKESRDTYDGSMSKYELWQERRVDLLSHFTKLEPARDEQ